MKNILQRTYINAVLERNEIRATLSRSEYRVSLSPIAVTAIQPQTITAEAGQALSGHRAVCVKSDGKAYYADANILDTKSVVGITTHAASNGESVVIQTDGELRNTGGWSFTTGDAIFVGSNGQIVQSDTGTAYISSLGLATKTDTININIFQSIIRT